MKRAWQPKWVSYPGQWAVFTATGMYGKGVDRYTERHSAQRCGMLCFGTVHCELGLRPVLCALSPRDSAWRARDSGTGHLTSAIKMKGGEAQDSVDFGSVRKHPPLRGQLSTIASLLITANSLLPMNRADLRQDSVLISSQRLNTR